MGEQAGARLNALRQSVLGVTGATACTSEQGEPAQPAPDSRDFRLFMACLGTWNVAQGGSNAPACPEGRRVPGGCGARYPSSCAAPWS